MIKIIRMMSIVLFVMIALPQAASAYSGSSLEVTNSKSAGDEVTVDINIHETRSLNAGSFVIAAPSQAGFELVDVELSAGFEKGRFEGSVHKSGNEAELSFIAKNSSGEYNVNKAKVATLTYSIDEASPGARAVIEIANPSLTDAEEEELLENNYEGTLVKQRPMGDVLGTNMINAGQAARILQHANGALPFSQEDRAFGDVNNDGNVAHTDARWILELITGKRSNFLHIVENDRIEAYAGSSFSYQLKAKEGFEPYEWSARSLPSGLSIDEATGEITGEPSREGEQDVTVTVEDRTGKEVSKDITFAVTESDIESVQNFSPVTVEQGAAVDLPEKAEVTYKDGTFATVPVEWNEFDTNQVPGEYTLTGTMEEGYSATVEVVVYNGEAPSLPENSITSISDEYSGFLGFHSITAEATRDVYRMEIEYTRAGERRTEAQDMFYENDNEFSKNLTQLERGSEVTITAYSEFDEKLTEKTHRVQ